MTYTDELYGLKGKVAVITGAGGHLCSSMAQGLANAGAKIALLDLRLKKAQSVENEIVNSGGTAISLAIDVADKEQHIDSLQTILDKLGSADILINGAGINCATPFFDLTLRRSLPSGLSQLHR